MGCKIRGCPRVVFNKIYGLCFVHYSQEMSRAEVVADNAVLEGAATVLKKPVKKSRRGRPRKNEHCILCTGALAKGSSSYCNRHERERVRKWRKKKSAGR